MTKTSRELTDVTSWLKLTGDSRAKAVAKAADLLSEGYRFRCNDEIPINLVELGNALGVELRITEPLSRDALITPVYGGFLVMTRADQNHTRRRTSIAHELAHTLFYSREGPVPTRLIDPSVQEEHFCFDVSRRLLAPQWSLPAVGAISSASPITSYLSMRRGLVLSRLVASRLLLQDYLLAEGIAGVWEDVGGKWGLKPGNATASPSLFTKMRNQLRGFAMDWITKDLDPPRGYSMAVWKAPAGRRVFAMVVRDRFSEGHAWLDSPLEEPTTAMGSAVRSFRTHRSNNFGHRDGPFLGSV